jgi:tetratricopeptide (TPR) repeat protein
MSEESEKQLISEKLDSKASKGPKETFKEDPEVVKKKNLQFTEKLTNYLKNLKFEDIHEFITFLRDLVILVNGIIMLIHFIGAGVPLGGRLKLLQPRNTCVRTDKPIFLKFEYAMDGELISDNFKYEISLREVDGGTVWGPFKMSKKIDPKVDVKERNSEKYIVIRHLLDYKNLESSKEYTWTVEAGEDIKTAIFNVIDIDNLKLLTPVERQVKQSKSLELNEKDFFLGVLYERMGLFDDAIEKYKSVVENDPSIVITLPRISMVYAKKATKFFTKKEDVRKLLANIDRDDVDLAKEADYWTRRWKDRFNQIIVDLRKEADNRIKEWGEK